MTLIYKNGAIVARSNTRSGIARRARNFGLASINVMRAPDTDGANGGVDGAILSFWFRDGSWAIETFADYAAAHRYSARLQARYAADGSINCFNF